MTATFPNCAVIVTMSGDRGYVYLSIKHDRRSREVSSQILYVAIMRHIAVKERYISFINIVKKKKSKVVLLKHYEDDEQRIIKYEPWTQKRDKPIKAAGGIKDVGIHSRCCTRRIEVNAEETCD